MKLVFSNEGWEDYQFWQSSDETTLKRLNGLINECRGNPFKGTGKPEPLKGDLQGWWSRRITRDDRLVYRVSGAGPGQQLEIAQCRYPY